METSYYDGTSQRDAGLMGIAGVTAITAITARKDVPIRVGDRMNIKTGAHTRAG